MEALAEPCEVSRDLFQAYRLVASSSVDRRGTVAKVRLYSATGPCLPWRTPSPSLLLPPLPQPLPPRSRRRCSCAASRSTPIVPAAPGSQARRSKSSGNPRVLAELRRWGTGEIRSGRGQRGKPGEPGQSVRGRSRDRDGQLCVREFGFPLLGPSFLAGLPHAGSEPRRAPPAMSPDWRWPVSTGRVRKVVLVEKRQPWRGALGSS